jgi:ribosomal protein S4
VIRQKRIFASRPLWPLPRLAGFPEWVEVDAKAAKGTYKAHPERSELPPTINESLVIELYSK